jgi:hypothetical protein
MAAKKIPTLVDAIKQFKDVTTRASLSSYYHVNKILLSINSDGNKILVVPDHALWDAMTGDKNDPNNVFTEGLVKSLDITDREQFELQAYYKYGDDLDNVGWFPIDVTEELFSGKIFKIRIAQYEYQIPINRELMPLKLKKAEYDGIAYRTFGSMKSSGETKEPIILGIKKRFEGPKGVDDSGFTIIRLFQVV